MGVSAKPSAEPRGRPRGAASVTILKGLSDSAKGKAGDIATPWAPLGLSLAIHQQRGVGYTLPHQPRLRKGCDPAGKGLHREHSMLVSYSFL